MSSTRNGPNTTAGSVTRNHSAGGTQTAASRRIRPNNNSSSSSSGECGDSGGGASGNGGGNLLKSATRRSDVGVVGSPAKNTKDNDIPQRILAILEAVPSTISVSSHPANFLPANLTSSTNNKSVATNSEVAALKHSLSDEEEEKKPKRAPTVTTTPTRHVANHHAAATADGRRGVMKRNLHQSQRILKRHLGRQAHRHPHTSPPSLPPTPSSTASAASNGMPPPSAPIKMNFRARALDPQRYMPVHIVNAEKSRESSLGLELHNNKALKRPLYNVHTGMEKEEEKEHDLRKAIEAQKKFVGIGNDHLIPTRQVINVDPDEYALICKWKADRKPTSSSGSVRDAFIYCDEDTSYDADEADMQFLRSSSNFLTVDEFEKIIEKLELESRDQVVSLHEFHRDHPELLIEPLTKVYDYWIERKMTLMREHKAQSSLVAYVPAKLKLMGKENPYVAFRHRSQKLTTRRKQRLDTEHFASMLRMAATIRQTHILTKALVERDALKSKLIERDAKMFEAELDILLNDGGVDELASLHSAPRPSATSNTPTTTTPRATNKCLAALWQDAARSVFNDITLRREESLYALAAKNGAEDGEYQFVRNPNCSYRLPRVSNAYTLPQLSSMDEDGGSSGASIADHAGGPPPFSTTRPPNAWLSHADKNSFKPARFQYLNTDI